MLSKLKTLFARRDSLEKNGHADSLEDNGHGGTDERENILEKIDQQVVAELAKEYSDVLNALDTVCLCDLGFSSHRTPSCRLDPIIAYAFSCPQNVEDAIITYNESTIRPSRHHEYDLIEVKEKMETIEDIHEFTTFCEEKYKPIRKMDLNRCLSFIVESTDPSLLP